MKEGNEMNGPRLEQFRIVSIGVHVFRAPVGTEFLFGVIGVFPVCNIYGLAQYDGRPMVMKQRDPGTVLEPSLSISPQAAQTLMDDLWHAGFRPTEGTGSTGALAATQRHLDDMRTLVFRSITP